ncbi:hypothetical protein HDV00_003334 [Rhizophlyctis rosea]|nr:hypothetical protein HDV00_003334 [Rhizophlyctis rosea]
MILLWRITAFRLRRGACLDVYAYRHGWESGYELFLQDPLRAQTVQTLNFVWESNPRPAIIQNLLARINTSNLIHLGFFGGGAYEPVMLDMIANTLRSLPTLRLQEFGLEGVHITKRNVQQLRVSLTPLLETLQRAPLVDMRLVSERDPGNPSIELPTTLTFAALKSLHVTSALRVPNFAHFAPILDKIVMTNTEDVDWQERTLFHYFMNSIPPPPSVNDFPFPLATLTQPTLHALHLSGPKASYEFITIPAATRRNIDFLHIAPYPKFIYPEGDAYTLLKVAEAMAEANLQTFIFWIQLWDMIIVREIIWLQMGTRATTLKAVIVFCEQSVEEADVK